jgi:LacI family transcriptional regulator
MPGKRITSHQVAERAGVSRTTVSLVLNNVEGTNISEATRQRVLQAARELGYVPHEAARSLAGGKTHTLAFIICQPTSRVLSDAYLPLVIHGLKDVTNPYGFRILVDWIEDVNQPDAYVNLAKAKKIDGMIVSCPRLDDDQLPGLVAEGFPLVLLGTLDGLDVPSVDTDNKAAAAHAVEHLVNLGHKRIACITNGPGHYANASDRLAGYRRQLEAAGLPYDEGLVRYGDFDPDSGYVAMKSLLELEDPPTAVFVASDVVAFGVLTVIREHGLRVPEDIAIVSFDDVPMARFSHPPLTTVHVPAVEQGRKAGDLLLALMGSGEVPEKQILLETELVIRQSCGASRGQEL